MHEAISPCLLEFSGWVFNQANETFAVRRVMMHSPCHECILEGGRSKGMVPLAFNLST
jgi:hypothetical protein